MGISYYKKRFGNLFLKNSIIYYAITELVNLRLSAYENTTNLRVTTRFLPLAYKIFTFLGKISLDKPFEYTLDLKKNKFKANNSISTFVTMIVNKLNYIIILINTS